MSIQDESTMNFYENQSTDTVVMVPPEGFAFNVETAITNHFQKIPGFLNTSEKAMSEFNVMVSTLKAAGIHVLLLKQSPSLPDAIFPNNWFSTHVDDRGKTTLLLYPMLTKNRQAEVNEAGVVQILKAADICFDSVIDLRNHVQGVVEGTGSLVFDRGHHHVYAACSARTAASKVAEIAALLNYKPVIFDVIDAYRSTIYHTNIMMSIGTSYVIICLEAIEDNSQRQAIIDSLLEANKEIIDISYQQLCHMCGNVLELRNKKGARLLVMSSQAQSYFTHAQLAQLSAQAQIIPVDICTIEEVGGGSARCMIAEIFHTDVKQ